MIEDRHRLGSDKLGYEHVKCKGLSSHLVGIADSCWGEGRRWHEEDKAVLKLYLCRLLLGVNQKTKQEHEEREKLTKVKTK